ncbi:CLUMA_CG004628, isoform A [Clunio marinus]|uniref:CLUMA_CG004628, isoform A n=1 Tax=Clunio marinus TaxID=568069 RepID=A0A1J1HSH8_9DIPT|nr:CLUMA_CG004628, isoform A [Clunio marinus]
MTKNRELHSLHATFMFRLSKHLRRVLFASIFCDTICCILKNCHRLFLSSDHVVRKRELMTFRFSLLYENSEHGDCKR